MTLFRLAAYGFVCMAAYYLVPKRFRWMILLAFSYGFYASRALAGLPFILLTTVTTWFAALRMGAVAGQTKARLKAGKATMTQEEKKRLKAEGKRRQRVWFVSVLALNFAILAVLKYTDDVLGWFGASLLGLLLPLGISFYTFQSMGYLIDVYNGKYAPERNPAKFALFVSFFPQLIQGPIGRYDQLAPQLCRGNDFDWENLQRGFLLMLWGLFKKMVIADRALPAVNAIFGAQAGVYGGAVAVLGVLLYSLQQYCDFSGGIDLVTGIAQQMGVTLAPNFRRPYFAVSLGDFWRRWHISLGAWMRDYVFYPFALTRPVARLSKAAKTHLGTEFARALPAALGNILVFLLVGVWHGATSNYILWGLYNGWFFDRCAHGVDALRMMKATLCDPRAGQLTGELLGTIGLPRADAVLLLLCTALLLIVSVVQERGVVLRDWVSRQRLPLRWLVLILGVACVLLLGVYGSGFDEATFIYYQF